MNCSPTELDMQSLGAAQFGVRGCGCQAVYIDANGSGGNRRFGAPTWVLNSTAGSCQMQPPGAVAQQ